MKIRKNDVILEVGSGDKPFKISHVLVDKFKSDFHRGPGRPLKIEGKPFIFADAEFLPFKDKSFDYVILSHVIEHVDNPCEVIKEITRVSSRGYIEFPTEFNESLFNYGNHKWIVYSKDDELFLFKKDLMKGFEEIWRNFFSNSLLFKSLFIWNMSLFNNSIEWEGHLKCRVFDRPEARITLLELRKQFIESNLDKSTSRKLMELFRRVKLRLSRG
jgi:SAM-dependent methyltransferase